MTENKQPGEQGKGMRGWVNCKDEKPAQEKECFFDGGELPPAWGRFRTIGKFDYVVVMESSGEEELYPYSDYERWLDETSAKGYQQSPQSSNEYRKALEEIKGIDPSSYINNHYDAFNAVQNIVSEALSHQPGEVKEPTIDSIRVSAAKDRLQNEELKREVAELRKLLAECNQRDMRRITEGL